MTGRSAVGTPAVGTASIRTTAVRTAVVLALVAPAAIIGLAGGIAVAVCLPYAIVGGLLAIRRPGNSIGWLLVALAWCFAFFGFPGQGTAAQFRAGEVTGLPMVLTVVQAATGQTMLLFLFAICVVFPSGRLPRGRAGIITRLALLAMAAFVIQATFAPTINASVTDTDQGVPVANPLAVLPQASIWLVSGAMLYGALALNVAGVVSLFVRLRHARGIEAAQLRWLVWSVAAIFAGIAIGIVGDTLFANGLNGLVWLPTELAFPLPPIAIGFAVLRYRLYDIDRIVTRSIAYAIVLAMLGVLFVGSIVALQALLTPVTGGSTVAVAGSTLLAFALSQPLARRVRVAVDRRFDRARYDADRAVAALAGRLRDQVDLGEIRSEVLGAVDETLRPVQRTLWLRER